MIKPTLHFFLIGGALLALRLGWETFGPTERPRVEVVVPAEATDAEVRARIDEELLVSEALRHGWLFNDPVIYRQLVMNMRFVEEGGEGDDQTLHDRALDLGMHRTDPVVRQRLIERVRLQAEMSARRHSLTDEELSDHLRRHPERFAAPARFRIRQVFLSRQRRGDALEDDARALGQRLHSERPDPLEAHRWGDPFAQIPHDLNATAATLDRRFGPGFGRAVDQAAPHRWVGPVRSSYGLHFVWIEAVTPGATPPLDEIRDRVAASLRHDLRHRRLAEHIRGLRRSYDIEVVREDGA